MDHIYFTLLTKLYGSGLYKYVKFNDFSLRPVANYKGEVYSLPFNMWTFAKIFNITKPEEAKARILEESADIGVPTNFEEQAIKLVGKTVYEKLI